MSSGVNVFPTAASPFTFQTKKVYMETIFLNCSQNFRDKETHCQKGTKEDKLALPLFHFLMVHLYYLKTFVFLLDPLNLSLFPQRMDKRLIFLFEQFFFVLFAFQYSNKKTVSFNKIG